MPWSSERSTIILIAQKRPWRGRLVITTGCLLYPIAWNYLFSVCHPTVKDHKAETTVIPQSGVKSSAKELAPDLRRSVHDPVAIAFHASGFPQFLRHVISALHAGGTFDNAPENAHVES